MGSGSGVPGAGAGNPTAGTTGLPGGGNSAVGGAGNTAGTSTAGGTQGAGGTGVPVNPGEGPAGYWVEKNWHGCAWTGKGDLGVTTIRLMSNNPAKFKQLEGYQLRIVERVPLLTRPTQENIAYLSAKQLKLGHTLGVLPCPVVPAS